MTAAVVVIVIAWHIVPFEVDAIFNQSPQLITHAVVNDIVKFLVSVGKISPPDIGYQNKGAMIRGVVVSPDDG